MAKKTKFCTCCGQKQRRKHRKNVRTDIYGVYWECSENCHSTLFTPHPDVFERLRQEGADFFEAERQEEKCLRDQKKGV